ncbi:hypothetical protein VTO42DRAFT_6345 [Malbranchea cinnamomea]
MQLIKLGSMALVAVTAVDAFRDTSPLFFFSTSEFESSSQQLESASSVTEDVTEKLSSCPSQFYILASQPGVHAMDYSSKRSAPRLREQVLKKDNTIRSSFTVSEVVGEVDNSSFESLLVSKCGAGVMEVDAQSGSLPSTSEYTSRPQIIKVPFSRLPTDPSSRAEQLVTNDLYLGSLIDLLPTPDYTVVYTTTPRNDGTFPSVAEQPSQKPNPESQPDPLHVQQKRITSRDDDDENSNQPLFEKYQFLSPGIFMGLLAGFVLLTILYAGFSALTSLQVSYASFTKESGPGTAKKQQ